ncbi:helix-turn-helix domain-containing protein [Erythrobacter jejuensis]|uniref:Helix-turn-helix domain-containing protein n=1 Tax=Parerythrobacter jejuensis TaxID=795812 RepID=A0A845AJA5_9SPHN|nr:helix-turn-helix domain-containing protein [Parerythrobacter jejuensis]MXP33552.1 helix-turn-helix domain-containing protein [Parerythrobacter jejuensis]
MRFFDPPAALADCLSTIYRLEVDLPEGQTVSDLLLPEWGNLRFFRSNPPVVDTADGPPLDGCRFQATGPSSRPVPFSIGATRVWGMGLLPLGWATYVGEPASALADTCLDGSTHPAYSRLSGLLTALDNAGPGDDQEFKAISDYLLKNAAMPREEHRIRAAQEAMVDPYLLQIPDFAERAGVSTRTLERLCLKWFGFTPNVVLRRQRLIRSLAAFMNEGNSSWSEAIDRHYHDQPHFVREFHYFMGMSPTEYAEQPHPIMDAFMGNRQQSWGKPAPSRDAPEDSAPPQA